MGDTEAMRQALVAREALRVVRRGCIVEDASDGDPAVVVLTYAEQQDRAEAALARIDTLTASQGEPT